MSPPSMHIEIIPSYIGWLIHRGRSSRCTLVLFSAFLGGNFRGWSGHQGIWNWYIPKIHWHGINIVSRSCRDLDARRATCRWQFMIDYLTHMWKTIIANESNETGNGLLCKSTTSQQNFERCFKQFQCLWHKPSLREQAHSRTSNAGSRCWCPACVLSAWAALVMGLYRVFRHGIKKIS